MRRPCTIGLALAASTSFAVAACGSPDGGPASDPAVRQVSSNIIGGTIDNSSNDAVVLVCYTSNPSAGAQEICSGSLIAPTIVLTARHCVSRNIATIIDCSKPPHVGADFAPSNIYILRGVSPSGSPYIARGKELIHSDSTNLCANDFALIILDRAITNITPLKVRVQYSTATGEIFRAIGYGTTVANDLRSAGVRYYRNGVQILGVDNYEFRGTQSICQGDSGGPAISSQGAVIGVTSRGPSCYQDNNIWTRVELLKSYLDTAIQKTGGCYTGEDGTGYGSGSCGSGGAGGSAGSGGSGGGAGGGTSGSGGTGGDPPAGTPCSSTTDCVGATVCVDDVGGRYCTPRCSSNDPSCPKGFECAAELGACFKRKTCQVANDCAPGWLCVESGGERYCTTGCTSNRPVCPAGYSCDVAQQACFKAPAQSLQAMSGESGGCATSPMRSSTRDAWLAALAALSLLLASRKRASTEGS